LSMNSNSNNRNSSFFGLDENVAGLLTYTVGFVSGITFFVLGKKQQIRKVSRYAVNFIIHHICNNVFCTCNYSGNRMVHVHIDNADGFDIMDCIHDQGI